MKLTGSFAGMHEKLLFAALRGMRRGRLEMELPDGRKAVVGRGEPGGIEARMQIRNAGFFRRCVLFGDVGFGEAFLEGEWTSEDPASVVSFFIANVEETPGLSGSRRKWSPTNLLGTLNRLRHLIRPNHLSGSVRNIREHYDFSNDFFRLWLDPTMTYSCAFFSNPGATLEEAQLAKIDRLLGRLELRPGMHVLEIGSGWGSCAIRLAEKQGCRVTTLTLSEEQRREVERRVADRGLSGQVEVRIQDYRKTEGTYDRIVSIEMIEAVGHRYFEDYFSQCHRLLKPNGLLGIQGILCPDSRYDEFRSRVDWIQRHVFPGSLLPSFGRIQSALRRTGDLGLHHFEEMGMHYAETLDRWNRNLLERREEVLAMGHDEREIRRWNYYFNYCKAAFAMRNITVAQMVFSRPNNPTLSRPVHA